jgi:hypothetical protein
MRNRAFTSALGLTCAVVACLTALPAQAIAETSTTCAEPALYQPFKTFGDSNRYALVPGQSYDNLEAAGWALSGGAKVVTTKLYDGTQGYVLNLPNGAKAVSPATCVNNAYPYLRTIVRSYSASAKAFIAYATGAGWGTAKPTGSIAGTASAWQLSSQVNLEAGPSSGWHLAQLTLVGSGSKSSSYVQIYNLFADPRMR